MLAQLSAAVAYIHSHCTSQPTIAMILGTGLGEVASEMKVLHSFYFHEIPHFPVSTVKGHKGMVLIGEWLGQCWLVLQGRVHFYEGYTMQEVAFPVYLMKLLGIKQLVVTNASGALNPAYEVGDIVLIEDHISFFLPDNPLRYANIGLGNRFVDMRNAYTPAWLQKAEHAAQKLQLNYQKGVYVAVQGAMLETKAEYRLLRQSGADIVGMSTVPEVIAAAYCGLEVLGLSVVTDKCVAPYDSNLANLDDFLAVAEGAVPQIQALLREMYLSL